MKRRIIASTIVLLAIMASTAVEGDHHQVKKWKSQIEALSEEMTESLIKGNYSETIHYYTEEAISMPNYSKMLRGKDALRQNAKAMKKSGIDFHSMSFDIVEVWASEKEVYEIGKYKTVMTLPGMQQQVEDNGKYLTVWRKQNDGSLKIKAEIWNTDTHPLAAMQSYVEPE